MRSCIVGAVRRYGLVLPALLGLGLLGRPAAAISFLVDAQNATGSAGAPVVLTAHVTLAGSPAPGERVEFNIDGGAWTEAPSPTDANGDATLTITAPAVPDAYVIGARLVLAPSASDTATLEVTAPATACRVVAWDRVCGPGDTVNLLAYLWEIGSYTGIGGKSVYFKYNGGSWQGPVTTAANGRAFFPVTAPGTPGVTTFDVKFDGDVDYAAASDSGDVTVESLRTSAVVAYNRTADPGTTITLPAYAYWVMQNQQTVPINGGKMQFHMFGFGSIWQQAITDATGKATTQFAVPAGASGAYQYAAEFLDDKNPGYKDSWATRTITVRAGATLTAPARAAGRGDIVNIFGYLKNAAAQPIVGKVLQIRVNGGSWIASAPTTAVGAGTITYSITEPAGVYTVDVKFEGDATTVPCSTTTTLTVNQKAVTYMTSGDRSGVVGGTVTLPAWLYRYSTSARLAGKPINFYVDGTLVNPAPVLTNATGLASFAYTITVGPGAHTLVGKFEDATDPDYLPSASPTRTLTVTAPPP